MHSWPSTDIQNPQWRFREIPPEDLLCAHQLETTSATRQPIRLGDLDLVVHPNLRRRLHQTQEYGRPTDAAVAFSPAAAVQ
jgi:hypothetical protein